MTEDNKSRVKEMLQKLEESYPEYLRQKFLASWFSVDRNERKRRLNVITSLIVELERIKKESIFSTGLGEQCVEAIIMGSWDEVEDIISLLSFKGEDEALRARYEPLWKDFVSTATAAAAWARAQANGTLAKS